ncbi:MAG: hemolysin family protein [Rikenellaceae bacterium]
MGLLIFYLTVALSISFVCSVLEAVLLSVTSSYISMKESEGAKNVKTLKNLKENIDRPLSAILSLNTVAHTVGAAGVGAQAGLVFGEAYFGLISAILTILILVLSEIIPKTLGASYWKAIALPAAPLVKFLITICYPLVWVSEFITRLIAPKSKGLTVSREEVSAMVNVGAAEGAFHSKENIIIQNLIRLEAIKAKEIMTPRVVVEVESEETTLREFNDKTTSHNYSRIPIYGGDNKDNITSYVLRQTILENLAADNFDMKLKDISREILTSPETRSIASLWERLIAKKEHISLIIDEYGSFEGIVTMEDIIETIIGLEILDEKDSIEDMQQYARERWANRRKKLTKGNF